MRPWSQESALIQPRASLGKGLEFSKNRKNVDQITVNLTVALEVQLFEQACDVNPLDADVPDDSMADARGESWLTAADSLRAQSFSPFFFAVYTGAIRLSFV